MAWNEPGPGKDPWSQGPKKGNGGSGGGQPPDLDELLRRLKARFSGGRGAGGGSVGGGGFPLPSGLIGLLLAALALLWVASGFYVVDEQERAVVLRFGSYAGTTEPGLRWRMPWPIEREEIVNVTGVRSARDTATMLTKDENIVDVELSVQYRISKVEDYVFNVEDPDMTLRQATKSAVREVVGENTMDFILTEGRGAASDKTEQLLQQRLDEYKTGLIVTEVNFAKALAPEQVQAAFDDAIKAREDQERLKNEAQAYANDRLPKARGAAARTMAEAVAYREQIVAKAVGDASRFTQLVAEYRKAPQVMRERLYLDAMTSVLENSSKIIVDVDKGNPMFYLPLDQLMKDTGHGATTPDYGVAPNVQPSTPRSGESPRSRERGR